MKGREQAKEGQTVSRGSSASHRPISYLRFSVRDDGLEGSEQQVSTLPPPPFENETDVAGLEWWLEAHMSLAGGQLCVEQAMMPDDSAGQAISARLEELRDALYEMYCDAADPRMHEVASVDGALGRYVRALYVTTEEVVSFMLDAERAPERATELGKAIASLPALDGEWLAGLGVDANNPLEPLRHIARDMAALTSAVSQLGLVLGEQR